MTIIQTIQTGSERVNVSKRFTPESFKSYGIAMSIDALQKVVPHESANQGSALKLIRIAEIANEFPSERPGKTYWDIFRSAYVGEKWENGEYICKVLERHPYSSQTFVPLSCDKEKDAYIVICAPDKDGKPDWKKTEVFVAKGGEAVTYNRGVWHAPMVVLVPNIDFCVLSNQNDVPEEVCEEVCFEPGFRLKV